MAFKIITTSSLIPRNGIDTLIQACALLEIDYQLIIAGDGPEEINLKNLAKDLPVRFLGRVKNNKIPQLLRESNLFVRPSRFEGFGSSFIEAMAVGIPIIGTPVGGITDFLVDNKTGFLVPINDPQTLAKRIIYVKNNPVIVKKIIATAKMFVEKNYNWNKIADQVHDEMQKLCC